MPEEKDYYAVLGVSSHTDRKAIAAAYERLARKYHPDLTREPDDPERMRQLDEAFDVLDDAAKRADYDRLRVASSEPTPGAPSAPPSHAKPRIRRLPRQLFRGLLTLTGAGIVIAMVYALVLFLVGDNGGVAIGEEVTTSSGLKYVELALGTGESPKPGQTIVVNYTGTLEDGTQFDSSFDRGQPGEFIVGRLIDGFDEGVSTMKIGGKRKLIIPPQLGYGAEGAGGGIIPPNATLIFEVELLAIRPEPTPLPEIAPATPPPVTGQEITAGTGLKYIDIQVGTGATPQSGQTLSVHYTGWVQSNGSKFDSSLDRGEPFTFVIGVGQVIDGWDQGIATMQVGGKRRLIIPPELAYGEQGFPPKIPANATLVFDVELLDVQTASPATNGP